MYSPTPPQKKNSNPPPAVPNTCSIAGSQQLPSLLKALEHKAWILLGNPRVFDATANPGRGCFAMVKGWSVIAQRMTKYMSTVTFCNYGFIIYRMHWYPNQKIKILERKQWLFRFEGLNRNNIISIHFMYISVHIYGSQSICIYIYTYCTYIYISMYLHHTLHIQLPPNLFFPPGLGNIWNVHYFIVASNPTSNWSVGFWNLHSGFHAMSESTPQLVALLEVPTALTQRLSFENVWCNLGINTLYI